MSVDSSTSPPYLAEVSARNSSATVPEPERTTALAVVASCFGWGLDLFDLFILLFVAPAVGQHFFPSHTPMLSLAGAYASFAVTLLMRPLGSALFGSYSDRLGRKRAMIFAIAGVGIATASFGILPTVETIGIWATVLFLLLRLVQGIFVGGVVASTHVLGTESVPERWRGTMSGLIGGGGAAIGTLLASFAYMAISALFPDEEFTRIGWRFMFFCGLITSAIGLVMFRKLAESPQFQKAAAKHAEAKSAGRGEDTGSPVRALFASRDYRNRFFVNLMLSSGAGAVYYLTAGYLPTYLKLVSKVPAAEASTLMLFGSVAGAVSSLLLGEWSQHIGRKKVFLLTGVLCLVALPLLIVTMASATGFSLIWHALAISFLGSAVFGPLMIFLNERFPVELRATGTGLSWNTGFAVGGIMPTFVSLAAATPAAIPEVLAGFIGAFALLYLLGAVIVPETKGRLKG
ncbi:MFS transporter [Novosphingobium sp. 9]|uniref:MFS transporter n=1 Tax=Novosphingobium sp. 9 TaxID=2025349 RepID=UPI0021B5AF73|nr:MFS transporter [Novosphingobium sp. 9]